MESIFLSENHTDADRYVSERNEKAKLKIGEVFYLNDDNFLMSCIHCTQEFHRFTEFTSHIQEHYRRVGIGRLAKVVDDTEDVDNRIEQQSNTSANDEFTDTLPDNDFEMMDQPADSGSEDSEPGENANIPNDSDHIVLQPLVEMNKASEESVQFIEGTDYKFNQKDHIYQCLICPHQTAAKWYHFRDHLLTQSNKPNVLCPMCLKSFANAAYVRKHVNRTHKKKITIEKIRAAQPTLTMDSTTTITAAAAAEAPVTTTMAEQEQQPIAESSRTFVEGEDYEKSNGRFKCLTCGREMLDHVKEHLMTHTSEKNVYCPFCGKAFIAVSYVRKHVNRAHKMKITADEIKLAQTTIDAVKENQNGTSSNGTRIHTPQTVKRKTADFKKNFECFDCHRLFTSLSSLRAHMKLHSSIRYLCPYCEKIFALRSYVRDHIVIIHGIKRDDILTDSIREVTSEYKNATVQPPFQCKHCKKICDSKQKRRQCMKSHSSSEGPVLCVMCGIVYKSRSNYQYHMARHHSDPNVIYQCSDATCQKTFAVKRYMLKHYRNVHLRNKNSKTNSKSNEIAYDEGTLQLKLEFDP